LANSGGTRCRQLEKKKGRGGHTLDLPAVKHETDQTRQVGRSEGGRGDVQCSSDSKNIKETQHGKTEKKERHQKKKQGSWINYYQSQSSFSASLEEPWARARVGV